MARAHIVVEDELLDAVDRIAGPRGRSRFIEAAIRSRLEQIDLETELQTAGPLIDIEEHPDWATSESTEAWVRKLRDEW